MAKKWSQLSGRQRNERAAKLSKNAGTRAGIPTKYLKGFAGADKLRAQRAMNQRLDSEFVPGSGVSNRQVARDRNAALDLEFAGPERELDTAIRDSGYHENTRLPAWFADYRASIQQAQTRNQDNAKFFTGLTAGLSKGDENITGQHKNEIAASQAAQQKVTGATGDPNAGQVADNASQIRRAMTESFGAGLISQASAQDRFLDDYQGRIIPGLQFAEQQTERSRGRKFADEKVGLLRERGSAGAKYMETRRDKEHTKTLENAAYGLKEREAELGAKTDAMKTNQWGYTAEEWAKKPQKERQRIIAQQKKAGRAPSKPTYHYGFTDKEWAKMSPEQRKSAKAEWDKAGDKPAKGKDKSTSRKTNDSTGQAWVGMRNWVDKLLRENPGMTRKQAVAHARRHHKDWFGSAKETVLSAALDLRFNPDKKVHPKNRARAKDGGLYIDSKGRVYSAKTPGGDF